MQKTATIKTQSRVIGKTRDGVTILRQVDGPRKLSDEAIATALDLYFGRFEPIQGGMSGNKGVPLPRKHHP